VDDMSNRKYTLKNKTKFFSFLLITCFIIFTGIYTASVSGYKEPEYQSIIINSGDTLWSIAEKYSDNCDIREYIYNIKKINDLDSSIVNENTAILIPIDN
jgi:hypothetical protein